MASTESTTPRMVPFVSARGKYNKETFRDMILTAIDYFDNAEKKGATFQLISDFIDREYKVRNDFIIRHQLKQLEALDVICKVGSKYGIRHLIFSRDLENKRPQRGGGTRKKKEKRKKRSKKRKQKRRKGKKRQSSSRKKQKKRKPIC